MDEQLLYYKPALVLRAIEGPDVDRFSGLFRVLKPIPLVDRTGAVDFPLRLKPLFPMPALRRETRSFEELCHERAREILARAEALDVDIYVMWSGGIDSTLILVTFLTLATPEQLRRIVVLLSEDSIAEAPDFYRAYICGKLRMESAQLFPYLLGTKHLFVSGEHNDQLFGSDMVGKLMVKMGNEVIHRRYDRGLLERFWNPEGQKDAEAAHCIDMFEHLARQAPVPIETNFQFLWWLNFNLKWQSVFLRTLSYVAARNVGGITRDYVENRYLPFFVTEPFQQWSLNNPDRKIRDRWSSYKWVCKDLIYAFTGDENYRRHKVKRGSLFFIILRKESWHFMTGDYRLHRSLDVGRFRQPAREPFRSKATNTTQLSG